MRSTIAGIALGVAFASVVACGPAAQNGNQPATNAPVSNAANANTSATTGTAPTFEPGTPQYIVTHQPDYMADITLQGGKTKLEGKVAKLGENWRIESKLPPIGNTITFIRPGQPTIMILEDKKQYIEYEDGADINPLTRTLQGLEQPGVKFEMIGTELVDGHPTTKYRGTKEGEDGEIVLYSAEDRQKLIIRIDGKKENVTFNATWSNVSLNPPPEAVQPPPDLTTKYKKVDLGEFQSMFSAGGGSQPTAAPLAPAPPGKK